MFEPEAKQEDILEHSGIKRLIDMALEGFSTTCFCYGQTGSGKTHTLTGPPFLVNLYFDFFNSLKFIKKLKICYGHAILALFDFANLREMFIIVPETRHKVPVRRGPWSRFSFIHLFI